MNCNIEKLDVFKKVLNDDYETFITISKNEQETITQIDVSPIENYETNLIYDEYKDLLKYYYQNIRNYLDHVGNYSSKLNEGFAIAASKLIILDYVQKTNSSTYVSCGDNFGKHVISNPFEELARLILVSVKPEWFSKNNNNPGMNESIAKIQRDRDSIQEGVSIVLSENGCNNFAKTYYLGDPVKTIGNILEDSNITSKEPNSARTKDNRGVILEQLDIIIDMYYTKLNFSTAISGIPTNSMSETLKRKFDNKVVYARRNIGVYEKTKKEYNPVKKKTIY